MSTIRFLCRSPIGSLIWRNEWKTQIVLAIYSIVYYHDRLSFAHLNGMTTTISCLCRHFDGDQWPPACTSGNLASSSDSVYPWDLLKCISPSIKEMPWFHYKLPVRKLNLWLVILSIVQSCKIYVRFLVILSIVRSCKTYVRFLSTWCFTLKFTKVYVGFWSSWVVRCDLYVIFGACRQTITCVWCWSFRHPEYNCEQCQSETQCACMATNFPQQNNHHKPESESKERTKSCKNGLQKDPLSMLSSKS